MTELRRFPTPEEVLAIEQAARRARAKEIRRLTSIAVRKLKVLIVHGAAALARKPRRTPSPARRGV